MDFIVYFPFFLSQCYLGYPRATSLPNPTFANIFFLGFSSDAVNIDVILSILHRAGLTKASIAHRLSFVISFCPISKLSFIQSENCLLSFCTRVQYLLFQFFDFARVDQSLFPFMAFTPMHYQISHNEVKMTESKEKIQQNETN